MPEQQFKKDQLRLNRGLNTESSEVNFPDGFTTDEQNYELLVDGGRRRRKALDRESGGSLKSVATITSTQVQKSFKWRGVDGDPSKNFIVHQVGAILYFTDDAETISTTYHSQTIDLATFVVAAATTAAEVADVPCSFTRGRGHLFVAHSKLRPFYIKYDAATDAFTVVSITLAVRDFHGIDDGRAVDLEPTDGTIPADHEYNIRNRGWKTGDITTFQSDKTKWPAKNTIWHKGYRRITDVGFSDLDGIQSFDSNKVDAEFYGSATAAMGSLFLNPLDTTYGTFNSGDTPPVALSTWDFVAPATPLLGGAVLVTTVAVHNLSLNDTVAFEGVQGTYNTAGGTVYEWNKMRFTSFNVDIVDSTTTFTIQVESALAWDSWLDQYGALGQLSGAGVLAKSDGKVLTVGPTAIEYHAGRVFYGGIPDSEWADVILFSEIALKPVAYGKCHQRADPTSPDVNALTPADGGTIVVPNLGDVKEMLSVRNSLLIFSDQGIWEIGGGQRGFFTADGYSVRKISEAECSSTYSPISFDNIALFTGPKGIYQVGPNEFTGALEATNVSEQLIQTLWNSIPTANQQVVQTIHDDALKRVYFLYGDSGDNINQYANALVLDIRVGAWYKFVFNVSSTSGILSAYAITESDSSDSNKKVKWVVQATDSIDTCDLDQTDFVDYDGAESPLPFMETGWDNVNDFQSRKQVPIITVYQKKTETGFTETGNGLDPDNESSCLMTAFWDWTDLSVSGKVGSQNQVYRHVRAYQPSGAGDTFADGYPVVVTRNRVRGRGRVLQLRFDGEATKDTHILGFTTNYKRTRKK